MANVMPRTGTYFTYQNSCNYKSLKTRNIEVTHTLAGGVNEEKR